MIINKKYKYIFIGLPFSASSAISKELIEKYGGKPLLHKHANIPILLKERPDIDLNEYTVFAVVRDPVEMVFSVYNKMLTNAHGVYTNPSFFLENGGHVSKRARKFFTLINDNNLSFEDYVRRRFLPIPYDNYLSENIEYIDFVLQFDNLNLDFKKFLQKLNIAPVRDLPLYNQTKKISLSYELSLKTKRKAFGAFLLYNTKAFEKIEDVKPSFLNIIFFYIFRKLRSKRWFKLDTVQKSISKSMID